MSDWRRPIRVTYAGKSGDLVKGRDMGRWRIEGPHAREDQERVLKGTVCIQCWTPYPETPSVRSAARIMQQMGTWGRPDSEAKRLLREGRCGVCGTEVSVEMAAFAFRGEEHSREVAPGVVVSGDSESGERKTRGGLVLPSGAGL